jgi:aminopeptidase N
LLNAKQSAYYRVNYDEVNWRMLHKQLKEDHSKIALPENRAQLLDDAFNLARAGLIPYSTPLNMATYLGVETEYPPWRAAFVAIGHLYQMFRGDSNKMEKLQVWMSLYLI